MLDLPRLARAAYYRLSQRGLLIRPWPELAARRELQRASLAIVGNAGYLSDIEQGDYIDSHDLVLRMNNFHTAGYERLVGKKLDIFLTTFHSDVILRSAALADARLIITSVPYNWSKPHHSGLKHRHAESITRGLQALAKREAYAPEIAYFQRLHSVLGCYPTTGAMGLLLAIDFLLPICASIYVTGFSFFEGRTHYYSYKTITPTNHDPARERELLARRLTPHLQSGQIRLDPQMQSHLKYADESTPNLRQTKTTRRAA
jgi:hypothetical protein